MWLKRGDGHRIHFKVSKMNVRKHSHWNELTGVFYFEKCGACPLWNANLKCDPSSLTSSGFYSIPQALILLAPCTKEMQGSSLMTLPGLLASVNHILNFTNEAYYLIINVTSIREATFQMNILDCLLWEVLEDDGGFSKFLELKDFFERKERKKLIWPSKFWCQAPQINDF